jgi:hypothetical protein
VAGRPLTPPAPLAQATANGSALVIPSKELLTPKYCEEVFQTRRRPTRTINVSAGGRAGCPQRAGTLLRKPPRRRRAAAGRCRPRQGGAPIAGAIAQPGARPLPPPQIGKVQVGSKHKVALQTMTTTDTRNVQATVDQVRGHGSVGSRRQRGSAVEWRCRRPGRRTGMQGRRCLDAGSLPAPGRARA